MNRRQRLRQMTDNLSDADFEYGVNDCSMFPAQWVADVTGKDLDLPFFDTREQAFEIIEKAGGLVNVWSNILEPAGFLRTSGVPEFGAVGVIETRKFGDVGVIFMDQGLACWRLLTGGVSFVCPRAHTIRRAWQIT